MTGVLRLKNDLIHVITTVCLNIISETISRNNLYYEAFYRIILKKANPPLTKCYSIYYGVKFQMEYLPLFVVILFNIWGYGPSWYCYQNILPNNINFQNSNIGWWIVVIYGLGEICTDILSELLLKLLIKIQIIDKNSNSHTITFVYLYYFETAVMYASFGIFIWNSLLYDCNIRCENRP